MSNEVVGETIPPETEAPITTTTTTTTTTTAPTIVSNDDTVVIVRTATLVFLLVLSLIGNALVVLSVAQARSSRFVPFNAFVLSMASYGLLECALTMSLATGFSIEKSWRFGEFFAGFNASFVQLQNIGLILTITAMSIDRYIAVTNFTRYHSQSSVHRANYVVLYTWMHAALFSLPLLFQNQTLGITCRAFVERCLCGLVEETSVIYSSLLAGLCFVLPVLLVVVFLCIVQRIASKENQRLSSSREHAAYSIQESLILKEARWCRYVIMLFLLFIVFKLPYIVIDILTQFNFNFVYEPATSTTSQPAVDGSRFYFQTAISWMMFCFSAFFPIVTFMQFPDHWRKMKSYITCSPITTSAATGAPLTRSQRQLRHKQRRLRQRQKIANRNARNKKRSSVANNSSTQTTDAPSSTSKITSAKIAVASSSAGEILFRVPVLYAATDGLHLVASEKIAPSSFSNDVKKKKTSSVSTNHLSSSNDVRSTSFPDGYFSCAQITQPSDDVIGEARPSSVVDKRVDVTGSRDCLHADDDVTYMNSDYEADDTESELNESANSRTLIWNDRVESATSVKVARTVLQSQTEEAGNPLHPHTPSPPPDEDPLHSVATNQSHVDNDVHSIDEHLMQRMNFNKLKLPSLKDRNIPIAFPKSNLVDREGPLLSSSKGRNHPGFANAGFDSDSNEKKSNGAHPDYTRAFVSEELAVDTSRFDDNYDSTQSKQCSPSAPKRIPSRKEPMIIAQHIGRHRHSSVALSTSDIPRR